jgi:hypothetical protein
VIEKKPRLVDTSKKVKNEHLPHGVDLQIWWCNFVPMFIMYIAQQDNPFEHNINTVSGALQKIWDVLFSKIPHMIVPSSPVYRLICTNLYLLVVPYKTFIFQIMQHVSDSWRNLISSAAIAVVLAFCNTNPNLQDSNKNCQLFASEYLKHLCFLYKVSDGDDVNVCIVI